MFTMIFAILFILFTLFAVPPAVASAFKSNPVLWFKRISLEWRLKIVLSYLAFAILYSLFWACAVVYVLGFSS